MKLRMIKQLTLLVAAAAILSAPLVAQAEIKFAEQPWSKPTYVYGAGLSEAEIKSTAQYLAVTTENTLAMAVDGKDIARYINGSSSDAGMISSTLVTKLAAGDGVVVEIKTPDNITQITQVQYANAAITAGVKDIRIDVAAVRPVTGESALTGVYKALEANRVTLDKDRMVVAQDELETVNAIAQENENKTDFSKQKFDNLIINIKNELNIYYNQLSGDKKISRADIEKIVKDAIAKNGLSNVLSQGNIDKLITLFEKYAKTDAINSADVVDQLKDLSGSIVNKAKELYGDAQASGLLDRVLAFFRDLIQGLGDFLRSLFQGVGDFFSGLRN